MDFPEAAEKIIAANSQVSTAAPIKDMVERFTFCRLCSSHYKGRLLYDMRLNMELDLQSLFGLHVHNCTHWLRARSPSPPPATSSSS
jgi:hypothetical protein